MMTDEQVHTLGTKHGRECAEQTYQRYVDDAAWQLANGLPADECLDVVASMVSCIKCFDWSSVAFSRRDHVKLGIKANQKDIYYNEYYLSAQKRAMELLKQHEQT